ncbi:MAG TPA: sugar phosphate isomerase/epimerase family protein [Gaiellaceae bacterium]|nr:sugar phosphate isomerase/epimerase family protein [Gaiellaceae bacterium]
MRAPDPPFAVCEFTTLRASFEEDLEAYRAGGATGIGICEIKLEEGRDAEALAALRASGLEATSCVPAVPSILPLPHFPGPEAPEERVEAIRASVRRLAPFEPTAVVCLTGPAGALAEEDARRVVVEGLRAIAEEGSSAGVPVGLEPMSGRYRDDWTLPTTLGEAAALCDDAAAPGLGITFDTWHLWDTPELFAEIERHGERIVAAHVNDWREETRGWCDRVLPGDGVADLAAILGALHKTGWRGSYDLEVFSDDGTFGSSYPDSLWLEDPEGIVRRGRDALVQLWEQATVERKR